jgi:hypothetical protein
MLVAGDAGGGGPRQGRGHQVGGVPQDAHQQAEGPGPHQTTIIEQGEFFWDLVLCMYFIQHCFVCRPLDSTVSEDAEIEPRTVATSALAVRR